MCLLLGWTPRKGLVTFRDRVISHFSVIHSRCAGHLNDSLQNKENELQEHFPLLELSKEDQGFSTNIISSSLLECSNLCLNYHLAFTILLSLGSFGSKDILHPPLQHKLRIWGLIAIAACSVQLRVPCASLACQVYLIASSF